MAHLPPPPADLMRDAALYLDFDGTLVEIAQRHDGVVVDEGLKALVPALGHALDGRVAIVSGRSAREIGELLGLDPAAPGIAIAGSHGLERILPDGRHEAPEPPAALAGVIADLEREAGAMPGVVIEPKPFGVTVHYRQAPEYQARCEALTEAAAERTGLAVQRGKMVCELKMTGADKGDAVRGLHAEPPMAGTRPVFVGDDLTDEAGFRAAAALGGAGVLVGERDGSAATYALPTVSAVRDWLNGLVA
jgi:trehalose 6-phosphate phosphatase